LLNSGVLMTGLGSYEVCFRGDASRFRYGKHHCLSRCQHAHPAPLGITQPYSRQNSPSCIAAPPIQYPDLSKSTTALQVAAGVYAQPSNPLEQMSESPPCISASRPPMHVGQHARTDRCAGLHRCCTPRHATTVRIAAHSSGRARTATEQQARIERTRGVTTEKWRDCRRAGVPPRGGDHGHRAPRLQDF